MAEPLLAEMVCPCDEHFVDYVTRRTCCVRCGRPPKRVLFLVCDITLSQEVWSARTGGRKPSPLVGSQGNLRAISTAGQRCLPLQHIDGEPRG